MKKYMPLEGLRWSRDSGSTLCDTPQNGRSRTGWGGMYRPKGTMYVEVLKYSSLLERAKIRNSVFLDKLFDK